MKVRLPKSYLDISQHDKDIINRVMSDEVQKQTDKNMVELQKLWLQFACIVLHRNFGFGKKRCLLFLANWREIYHINNKLESKADQTEFLNEYLDKIFGKDGYPTEYIDKLEEVK
jgi:hypothetical protein